MNLLRFTGVAAGVICYHNLTHEGRSVFNEKKHIISRKMQRKLHLINYFIRRFLYTSTPWYMKFHYKIKQKSDVSQTWKQHFIPSVAASRHAQACTIPRIPHILLKLNISLYSLFHRPLKPCMRAPLYFSVVSNSKPFYSVQLCNSIHQLSYSRMLLFLFLRWCTRLLSTTSTR